ncbi:MAG: hypothetical protein ACI8TX_002714 [Hyphomicrobiaceae bacterium]|jgi:hypothetical protein
MKMFSRSIVSGILVLFASAGISHAHDFTTARPDGHAPIGVMADHTHKTGEIMLSYRYMRMEMEGNRSGNNRVSVDQVLSEFPIAPTRMTMDMQMLGLMWAPNDQWTLTVMAPWLNLSMDHRTRSGGSFTTRAEGFGDIRVSALRVLFRRGAHSVHAGMGIGLPTGSINQRGTPMGAKVKLPYPMQLGSGTWDLHPSLTYAGQDQNWSWGSQVRATIRPGRNDNGYSLGDRAGLSVWGARQLGAVSVSLRLDGELWGDIDGADSELNPAMVPTARPDLRGGRRLDAGIGVNWALSGIMAGHRLAAEFLAPVAQHLDGPQLETDWSVVTGWQYTWG